MMDKTGDIKPGKTPPRGEDEVTPEQLERTVEKTAAEHAERRTSKSK